MHEQIHRLFIELSFVEGCGPARTALILNRVCSAKQVRTCLVEEFVSWGVGQVAAQKLYDGLHSGELERLADAECRLADMQGYRIICRACPEYPSLLAAIEQPPTILYVWGAVEALNYAQQANGYAKTIAMVGSRKVDTYGTTVTQAIAVELTQTGWCLVSGGAYGVDAVVHRVAVTYNKPTVVVLGSGLCRPYPAYNMPLFTKVAQSGGVIISPFAFTTEPLPGNFPARNRIIAGLSRATVVVRAAQKSGALITAQYALDQGRDVFAVPGAVNETLSTGCNELIRAGAQPVWTGAMINDWYGMHQENKSSAKEPILEFLQVPRSCQEVAGFLNVPFDTAVTQLVKLELDGIINQYAGLYKLIV